MDKKLMKYGIILGGVLIAVIIFALIINSFSGGAKYSYDGIEEKLVSAAKKYVSDKKKAGIDILPESYLSDSLYLSSDLLVNEGYLKDLSSYAKDDTLCVGSVNVYNAGGELYDYVPELTCGSFYETVKLTEKVLSDNDNGIVQGSGLYVRTKGRFITNINELNTVGSNDIEYVFRGDEVNNFVKIDDNLWRIVSIDNNNDLLLIYNDHSRRGYAWDDKYNASIGKYQGVNTFYQNGLESTAYKAIKDFADGTLDLKDKIEKSKKINYLSVPMNLCIGKRSVEDKDQSGSIECKVVLEDQLVGLLPAYSYMNASLDSGCETIDSKSCGNYNYLSQFDNYWWLLTANSTSTNEAYTVSKKYAEKNLCNYRADIRPTIKISSGRAIYSSGNGTLENPYSLKFYSE